ncbi:hypothetical protein Bacsa_2206 [Phocaeicola salanitronis DSM 18170]|uniref:Uncharacterized protein n=1 Tax=Phocaeicola salanitronis (strain DSM 18170 / JCM 13657 / CCUG 60908 / BL78) TaxID=667015 RepID=F0R512_PHOSB|nr:hypothetical protein Bacsa_2206 [Phocaeicola salanitronis DSM 18170]
MTKRFLFSFFSILVIVICNNCNALWFFPEDINTCIGTAGTFLQDVFILERKA